MKQTFYTLIVTAMILVSSIAGAQTITAYAGTGTSLGYAGDGGAATAAKLYSPGTSCIDAAGNLYIADKDNHRIRKVTTAGTISTIAGTGTAGLSGDGGAATAAQLSAPLNVAVDGAGNLYIADHGNSRIRKINSSGTISTVAGSSPGFSGDMGAATAAQMWMPTDVAIDAGGNIYICDYNNSRIRKVNSSGIITTIAGVTNASGTAGYNGDGIPAIGAKLNYPNGVCVDAAGNVYIADMSNLRIRKIDAAGNISTVAGTGIGGYTGDNGPATSAKISGPAFITADIAGNVFFSDMNNAVVRRIGVSGTINTIAGNGTAGYSGDGGAATAAMLSAPTGVVFDADNNLYITEQGNHVVRKVTVSIVPLSGITTVCAGSTTALSSFVMDGKWTSSNPSVANVNPTTGDVTGVSGGTAVISYSMGLAVGTTTVTVNPAPNPGAISGVNSECIGGGNMLGNTVTGGVWSSSNTAVATVSATGTVTGITAGVTTISYTASNSCGTASATFPFTVNPCVVGVAQMQENNGSVVVYPNPVVAGSFSLRLPVYNSLPVHIIMSNSLGQKVKEMETMTNGPLQISTNAPAGIYLLSVVSGDKAYQAKVVIK